MTHTIHVKATDLVRSAASLFACPVCLRTTRTASPVSRSPRCDTCGVHTVTMVERE